MYRRRRFSQRLDNVVSNKKKTGSGHHDVDDGTRIYVY